MELLEKPPDVIVKGDGAEIVKHVSPGSAKQIIEGTLSHLAERGASPRAFKSIRQRAVPAVM